MKIHYETERLILRDIELTDDQGMFELDSDPEVHLYLGGKPVKTIEESREMIKNIRKQYVDVGIARWAVIEKSSGKFIGWSGIKFCTNTTQGDYYDLGYRFIRSAWNKGYATESAKPAIQHAFNVLKIPALYANAMKDNAGSRHVLEKLNFQFVEFYTDTVFGECAWYTLKVT